MGRTKSGILKYTIILLVLLSCIGTAHAANIVVGESLGNNIITAAITNATDGDIIIVSDGTYIENIIVNKEVTIRAENGSANTVVHAASPDHVFNITANNVTIHGFNITDAAEYSGIYLHSVSNCNISDNVLVNNSFGIHMSSSTDSTLTNNTINSNEYGIFLYDSTDNTLIDNTMTSNGYNFGVYGTSMEHFIHDINPDNLVNEKPIWYLIDQADMHVPSDAGQVYVVNSTNVTVKDITISNCFDGVTFAYTDNSKIENVTTSECEYGLYLFKSDFNILNNISANNNDYGIIIDASNNNTLSDSNVNSSTFEGIYIHTSSNYNTLNSNTANGNYLGILLQGSDNNDMTCNTANNNFVGIYYESSANNSLVSNTANGNLVGIALINSADRNTLDTNTANGNWIGIVLQGSDSNDVTCNTANSNYIAGIELYESNDNELIDNTANSNSLVGIILEDSSDNVLTNNIVKDSTGDSVFGLGSMNSGYLSNDPFNEYNIIDKFNSSFVSSSANMINSIYIHDTPPVSYGIYIEDCSNNTLSGTYSTGNYYAFYALRSLNTTVNNLILTEDLAQMSFVTDYGKNYLRGYDSNSASLSGKTNVNGYVDLTRSPDYLSSIALVSVDYIGTDIKFHYEDSGMSNEDESSIALFRLNGNEWVEVPNATLNTSGNYVSAIIAETIDGTPAGTLSPALSEYTVTLALFKDGETPRSNSGSAAQRERREGTITDLPRGNDGGLTKDTVVKSSDSTTTLTLFTGTKALDPLSNPVNSIIVTTPSSLPSDTPREVIESGLYFRFGPSGTTFSQDVMITMDFDPADFEGRTPVIYTYTSEDGWIALETTVDWENGRATAMISHFSLYALFGTDSEETQEIVVEVQEAVAGTFTESAEETPVKDKNGFSHLYWIIGIVIVLALGIVIVKKQKDSGGL
ncbi:cell surface protein [Methanolobus psychrophilus R15]|nr:cell surface protein [Methanolobus psychrophilus R15]